MVLLCDSIMTNILCIIFILLISGVAGSEEVTAPSVYPFGITEHQDFQQKTVFGLIQKSGQPLPLRPRLVQKIVVPEWTSSKNAQPHDLIQEQELPHEVAVQVLPQQNPTLVSTIYFSARNYSLNNSERKNLLSVINGRQGVPLKVMGFSSPRGDFSFNTKLSIKRAEEVASFLKANGFIVKEAVGFGPDQNPKVKNNPRRRVEIYSIGSADIPRVAVIGEGLQ